MKSQLKLKKQENITIASWINDREITSPDWEVYSQNTTNDYELFVLVDKQTNNQVRIEIKRYTPYKEIVEDKPIAEVTEDKPIPTNNEDSKENESEN
jgi:hypothetical protein